MPRFSQQSVSKLSTCHADLQKLFFEVIKYIDCTIIEGYRSQADQDADFAAGKTQLKWPNGNHNAQPSNAVDVMEYPMDWTNMTRINRFAGFVLGIAAVLKAEGKMTYGVRWGGDWDGNDQTKDNFFDGDHFELIK